MLWRGITYSVVAWALVVPSAAQAQDFAQPESNSPAGVEYELPLDQARREADGDGKRNRRDPVRPRKRGDAGDGSGSSPGSDDAPLFGEGISPGGGGGASGDASGGDSKNGEAGKGGSRDRTSPGAGSTSGDARANVAEPSGSLSGTAARDGGSNSTLLTGAIVLAVLLIGGLTALVVRRSSGRLGS